ncbi:MAG: hypothetical protein AB8B69_09175 [Chitinophagales bacterium]
MQKVFGIIVGLCLFAAVGLSSCLKGPEYPIEPHITNVTIDKTVIDNFSESFVVSIDFEDGDGDLGADPDVPVEEQLFDNIFLVDNRVNVGLDSVFTRPFSIEMLTPTAGSQAIDGTIRVTIAELCCYNEGGSPACFPSDARVETNEVVFDVYILDRAGHQSNVVQTPPLTIQCK